MYSVQVGAYKSRLAAEDMLRRLTAEGYPAYLIAEDGYYKARVGAFEVLDNAAAMERRLRAHGYDTFMAEL